MPLVRDDGFGGREKVELVQTMGKDEIYDKTTVKGLNDFTLVDNF